MDAIKDFFAELKERASNPLISSFVIAWLLINWPVTIGLLFYTQKELELDHIKSYTDLITRYSSVCYYTIYPLLIALAYTFLFPYVKAWIKLVHAKVSAKNDSDILRATEQGMMPVKKYVELRDTQQSMTAELQALIDSQGEIHALNTELTGKLAEESIRFNDLMAVNSKLNEQLADYSKFSNARLLNGLWTFTIHDLMGEDRIEKWYISDGNLTINGETDLKITNMVANRLTSKIAFAISAYTENASRQDLTTYWFTFNSEFTELHDLTIPKLSLIKEN